MKPDELEDVFIRSLDVPMTAKEKESFLLALRDNPSLARQIERHAKVRELLLSKEPATFGPYFASKLILKIQNTGVVIDRQIFSFFKRFQLAAVGVVVALLILNVVFASDNSFTSVLGLDNTPDTQPEQIVSFDFYETLNK